MPELATVPGLPEPAGRYSHSAVAGGLLFTAGFGPQHPETGEVADSVADQTRQVMQNIGTLLRAHGLDFTDIVKATVHLEHLKRDFADFNAAYGEFFQESAPVRTTVGSDLMNILVEIDIVAALR